jgi:hypothetical protein
VTKRGLPLLPAARVPPPPRRDSSPRLKRDSDSAQIDVLAVGFEDEPSTKPTTESLAVYQSLLSVFDGLSPAERTEFVELAAVWASMRPGERRALLGLISRR